MKKDIEYYMNLPYEISLKPIPDSLGGGYVAVLPEIGRFAITGDGETEEEAVQNLRKAMRQRFEEYLERGISIPEPAEEDEYSGRFVVRLPKELHRQLARAAKQNGASLNQYVTYLLTSNLQIEKYQKELTELKERILSFCKGIPDNWSHTKYSFPTFVGDPTLTESRVRGKANFKVVAKAV